MQIRRGLRFIKWLLGSFPYIMQISWVIGVIGICAKFEYKVGHTFHYLFEKCQKIVKGITDSCSFLSKAIKNHLQNF